MFRRNDVYCAPVDFLALVYVSDMLLSRFAIAVGLECLDDRW